MIKPIYKIETYTGAVLDYSITDSVPNLVYTNILTDGIGFFNFSLPTIKGSTNRYYYNDIALHDKIKIYLGYATLPTNPNFVGRITNISAITQTPDGYARIISGFDQGEILLRRQKTNKLYNNIDAADIVNEIIDDLSTGDTLAHNHTKVDAKTTDEIIEVPSKTYFDLLQEVSDYYYDGTGNDVKSDFFVDADAILNWKIRPIRTSGVETLTVGSNIQSYNVKQAIEAVRNSITVYGNPDTFLPRNKDTYTDTISGWSWNPGTANVDGVNKQVGVFSIKGTTDASSTINMHYHFPSRVTLRTIKAVKFWTRYLPAWATAYQVRLWAPDVSNYFYYDALIGGGGWTRRDLTLGEDNVYDASENPNGEWREVGSPNWWDLTTLECYGTSNIQSVDIIWIDGFHFYPDRWVGYASNAGSITSYNQRDLEVTDDKLHSDDDCSRRAQTLLYQKKDAPTELEVTVKPGNTNILIGDRLPITIPSEGITAVNFDVVRVEQSLSNNGFITKAVMVYNPTNNNNLRERITSSPLQILSNARQELRRMYQHGYYKH